MTKAASLAWIALLAAALVVLVAACGASPDRIGIDWVRAASVQRPADAFDVPSNRPFSTGLGNSGHPLHFPGQAIMADVVRTPGGFASVGYVYPGWHPAAWTSPDGETWSLRPMESTEFTFPMAVAIGRSGTLVAVGRSGQGARTWRSADGGRTWQFSDIPRRGPGDTPERMTTVMATPEGFLAGGSAGPENFGRQARFWTSPDGIAWLPVADDPSAFENAEVRSIVRTAEGYVALGWVGSAREVSGSVAWRSPDGQSWQRVDDPALASGRAATVIEAPSGGLVAVGTALGDVEGLVWGSASGASWTLVPGEASRRHSAKTRMTDLTSVGAQLIAVGNYNGGQYGTATAWVSRDGLHWEEARSAPVQEQSEMYAVTPGGPGVVAVGSFGAPDDYIPTVWLSPSP